MRNDCTNESVDHGRSDNTHEDGGSNETRARGSRAAVTVSAAAAGEHRPTRPSAPGADDSSPHAGLRRTLNPGRVARVSDEDGLLRNSSRSVVITVFDKETLPMATMRDIEAFLEAELACVKIADDFQVDARGVHYAPKSGKETDTIARRPFWVHGESANEDGGDRRFIVRGVDRDGRIIDVPVAMELLHRSGRLSGYLAEHGLDPAPGSSGKLAAFLYGSSSPHRLKRVDRTGWVFDGERRTFVLPRLAIAGPDGLLCVDPSGLRGKVNVDSIHARGHVGQWREEVLGRARGNPVLMFTIMAGLAAPLLRPVGLEGGGFHSYGPSSTGKTTAAQVCASVWGPGISGGDPAVPSYMCRWNTTSNALEALANTRSGLPLVLDELGEFPGIDLDQVIYKLSSGEGKARMTRDIQLRESHRWQLLMVSTGETSVQERLASGTPRRMHAGQQVRMVDIPTGDSILVDCHGSEPGVFADAIKQACSTSYGTAGPAFVSGLLEVPTLLARMEWLYHDYCRRLLEDVEVNDAEARVIKRFALVACAGKLAHEMALFMYPHQEVFNTVKTVRDLWLNGTVLLSDTMKGVVAVQRFIEVNLSRMVNLDDHQPRSFQNSGAMLKHVSGRTLVLMTSSSFRDACGGHNAQSVAQQLRSLDLLHQNNGDKLQSRFAARDLVLQGVPGPGGASHPSLYAVDLRILEQDFETRKGSATGAGEDPNTETANF